MLNPGATGPDVAADTFGQAVAAERSHFDAHAGLAARSAALDRISHGAIIVAADGRVLFANNAARKLAEGDGFKLSADTGVLQANHPEERGRLASLIAEAAGGGAGGSVRITRARPLGMLAALVSPLLVAARPTTRPDMALVTMRDLAATADIAPSQLMDLFGLTAAEAAIVPQLLEGDTAHLIAQSRGVSAATVRGQAARVLAKTGAANLRALATMATALAV